MGPKKNPYQCSQYPEQDFDKKMDTIDKTFAGGRALLGGPEYGLMEILQNGACQKKIKNHFIPQFSELSKNSLYSCVELCTMVAKSLEKNLVTKIRFQILTSR